MRRLAAALPLALALALAACGGGNPIDSLEGWEVMVGQVEPSMSSVQAASAPLTARAGVPFAATVTTLGSGSCTREAGGRVTRVDAHLVIVEPLDSVYRGDGACTRDLRSFPRAIPVTFSEPGDAVVRVIGRPLTGQPAPVMELPVRVEP